MEDYKKKYEEALERARDMLSYKEVRHEDIEYLFPELKESEDERTRKEIIEFLDDIWHLGKNANLEKWDKCDCSKWICWLEKQKEPELEEDFGDFVERLHSQFPEVSFAKLSRIAVRVKNWLEKQWKKEYALKSSKDEDVRKFMQYIEKEAKAYKFNLPNRSYDIYAFAKDILAWLERLKKSDNVKWLPSELQLDCLSDAVDAYHRQGYPAEVLTSLLYDLRKYRHGAL